MVILKLILGAVIGYLLGSLNIAIIVGKIYGVEIRGQGSKNAGLTNSLRVLGKKAALFTLLGDLLKGITACVIGNLVAGEAGLLFAGFMSIIGHNWPIYFNFKGGKGVLTSFAVLVMMDYRLAIIVLLIFIIVVALTKYVSLGSIIAAVFVPLIAITGLLGNKSNEFILITILFALLIVLRHYPNIKRLLNGTESKFGIKANKDI